AGGGLDGSRHHGQGGLKESLGKDGGGGCRSQGGAVLALSFLITDAAAIGQKTARTMPRLMYRKVRAAGAGQGAAMDFLPTNLTMQQEAALPQKCCSPRPCIALRFPRRTACEPRPSSTGCTRSGSGRAITCCWCSPLPTICRIPG